MIYKFECQSIIHRRWRAIRYICVFMVSRTKAMMNTGCGINLNDRLNASRSGQEGRERFDRALAIENLKFNDAHRILEYFSSLCCNKISKITNMKKTAKIKIIQLFIFSRQNRKLFFDKMLMAWKKQIQRSLKCVYDEYHSFFNDYLFNDRFVLFSTQHYTIIFSLHLAANE